MGERFGINHMKNKFWQKRKNMYLFECSFPAYSKLFFIVSGDGFPHSTIPFFSVALKPLLSGETLEFTFMNKSKSKFPSLAQNAV